jgi:hypothetical protein
MSRGHGKLQRHLLAIINEDHCVETFTLAALAYQVEPDATGQVILNESQLASVRRSLLSLKREGLVMDFGRGPRGRRYWASERYGLWSRIRALQQKSVVIAASGNEAAFRKHADEMLPMIERAQVLGVDFYKSWEDRSPRAISSAA